MPEIISTKEISFWGTRYEEDQIAWHISDVHEQLVKYLDLITGGKPCKFLIPLCGKTVDIPFLLSKGHEVFGIEGVVSPVIELGKEHSLNLQYDEAESLYYTEDRKLQIYCGDFFQCPIEKYGPFDAVWDRGSFVAIDYELRADYIEVMKRGLQKDNKFHNFKYLLQTVQYDKSLFGAIPRSVDADDIAKFYSTWSNVQILDEYVAPEDSSMRKVSKGMPNDITEMSYFVQPL